jgi:flagellar motility protein MotE (MotC chaperone)
MKNVMLLGLVAGVLFAVSAGLSLWLNQAKPTEEADAKATTHKAKSEDKATEKARSAPRAITPPVPNGDMDDAAHLTSQLQNELSRIVKREEEIAQQQEIYQIVIEDIRFEMGELQRRSQQLSPEARQAQGKLAEPPVPGTVAPPGLGPPLPDANSKKTPGDQPMDPKAVKMVSGLTESMPAENAARIVEQLVKGGKTDTVIQLLSKMNARHAARILSLVSDEKMAVDLLEKLLEAKRSTAEPPAGVNK